MSPKELVCQQDPNAPFCGKGFIGTITGSAIDQAAAAFAQAEVKVLGLMISMWTKIKTPNLDPNSLEDPRESPVTFLQSHTHWLVAFVAVLGLLIASGRLAWHRRGEPARDVASGLFTLVVVTGCGSTAVAYATIAGDAYSDWIINQSFGEGQFDGSLTKLTALTTSGLGPGLLIIVALFAIISSLIQMALLLVRVAMLGLLTGFLPIAGAAALTPEGRAMWRKMLGWLIAFILYKPVAATIYAFSFKSLTSSGDLSQLTGIVMIIMSVVALPALMRFIVPMVGAASGSGSGAAAGAAVAGAAMGARLIPSMGGGGGSGGGGGGQSGESSPDGSKNAEPGRVPDLPTPGSSPGGGQNGQQTSPSNGTSPSGTGGGMTPPQGGGMSGAPGAGVHPAAAIAEETVGLINKGKNAAESAAYDVSGEDGPGGSR